MTDDTTGQQAGDELHSAEARRQAQAVEYGTYEAAEDIFHDGVLIFAAGHPVPVGHVEKWRDGGDLRADQIREINPPKAAKKTTPAAKDGPPAAKDGKA